MPPSAAPPEIAPPAGTPVELHMYDGEGHGWRRATTVADELARIDAFLQQWLP